MEVSFAVHRGMSCIAVNVGSLIHCASWNVLLIVQGMSYDHVELKLYINGRPVDARFTGIRGTVFPVMYGTLSSLAY